MSQGNPTGLKGLLGEVARGSTLTEVQAEAAFEMMMSGDATPAQMGGFLMALRVRGETVAEITGAARAMRARAVTMAAPAGSVDTCGTGGDGRGTFNVSTAAAFVIAACGVPVAKHGNRAMSSKSGSADVLAALGVDLEAPLERIERSIATIGLGFLMAPRHHAAMRHVGPTRVELGTRTIFNLLGPLANPAGVRRQVVGVFAPEWLKPLAEVLQRLGSEAAWIVHGEGLDELTTAGTSRVAALENGIIREFTLTPEEVGLRRARVEDYVGGTGEENAAMMRALLAGAKGPLRDITLLNAAAALKVAGRVGDLISGLNLGGEAIDSGAASRTLDGLVRLSREAA